MKKIMLVDDEILVRIGIKSIVEWERYGYQLVAEASNGEEAFELIKKHKPDIVLTDLVMSPMDGFELIQKCRMNYPNIKFVVLSSYNDMDNVKKAMKLGALDYIFKLKVTPEGILEVLNEISDVKQADQTENAAWKNIPEIKQRLITSIIEKSYMDSDEIYLKAEQLGTKVDLRQRYILMLISIDDFEINNAENHIREESLLKFSAMNICEEVLEKEFVCDVFNYKDGDMVVLIQKNKDEKQLFDKISDQFAALTTYLQRYLGISISAGVSEVCSGIDKMKSIIEKQKRGLSARIYKGKSFYYRRVNEVSGERKMSIPMEGLSRDFDMVLNKEGGMLKRYVEHFFDSISTLLNVSEIEVRKYYMELYYGLVKAAQQYKIDIEHIVDDNQSSLYIIITKGDTLDAIKEGFLEVADQLVRRMQEASVRIPRSDILNVKKYIRNNLAEELTVTTVSEKLGINGSYFSHIFKKETGQNFVDYVNYARIQRAKELLLSTDYRVYEIARMVGIDNPNYFSIIFKKITGRSPNDVRGK